MEPPLRMYPAAVNDTVALDTTPGVSMLVSHVFAPVSTPAVTAFVVTVVGPSVTAPPTSFVVRVAAVDSARTDGGVLTPPTVNATAVPSLMSAPPVTTTNVRVDDVQLPVPVVDANAPVNPMGLLPAITQPPSSGSWILIDPPCNTAPDVVNDTVVVDVTPGVSTKLSHTNAPAAAPATIGSAVRSVGPATTEP
jgi:hypothetical protein